MCIYFDISAVLILILLLFSIFYRGMIKGSTNACFLLMIFLSLISACSELAFGTAHPDYFIYSIYIYLAALTFTPLCYMVYIVGVTDTWHKILIKPYTVAMVLTPAIVNILLLAINPWTQWMFTITNSEWHRAAPMLCIYLADIGYLLIGTYYLLRYNKFLSTVKIVTLIITLWGSVATLLIQLLFPHLGIASIGSALCLLLISFVVHRPEERVDIITGLNTKHAYLSDMQRDYLTRKHVKIILIDITNIDKIKSIMPYDTYLSLIRSLSSKFQQILRPFLFTSASSYYLDNGRFRIVLFERDYDKIFTFASTLRKFLQQPLDVNKLSLSLNAYVCIMDPLSDTKDFESLQLFESNYTQGIPYSQHVIYARDYIEKDRYRYTTSIHTQIDKGFSEKKFQIYYQPIYSLKEKRFTSAEALIRLQDDAGKFISPEIFIPIAEQSGAIHKIGDFVIKEVFNFVGSDTFKKLQLQYMEVNLSVAQCMEAGLADRIIKYAKQYNVNPATVNFEITETAAEQSQVTMMNNIQSLLDAGFHFSLDDYGTGYSSISRVVQIPLAIIKLDKTFADTISSNVNDAKMNVVLQHTVRMAKDMNVEIVVEGVETEEALQKFEELKCELIQGYYFSKPLALPDFVAFVEKELSNNT